METAVSMIARNSSQALARKHLLERELKRYLSLLAGHDQPEQVILFGSLVTGKVRPESDIDLVIIKQTELPFWKRLREMRRLLQPRVGTDILVYTPNEFEQLRRERPFFRDEILGKGRVIYE
jgi:predicted nucleotidyltransferase